MENSPKFLGDPGMKFLGQYTYTVPAEQFVAVAVVVTAVGAAVVVTVVVDAVVVYFCYCCCCCMMYRLIRGKDREE